LLKVHLGAAITAAITTLGVAGTSLVCSAGVGPADLPRWSMVAGILLFPIVVTTGTSGHFASGGRLPPRIRAKRSRMPWIGGPTLFGIVPLGVIALKLASHETLGWLAPAVHGFRGAVAIGVLTLMALSARDGLALTLPRRRALARKRG
ncbi:MAG: hypothetical protein KC656_27455, partial [Myxococcales bacterium]|nr:hypothetical protein [Myxococcales bacterium]